MAKRSPILGYNHNVRHRGLVFHVQTEDSGIVNPHLFTHLFHGGTILSSRKMVYDPDAAEDIVRGLMQAQHKAVLKDLKRHAFDDKIDLYFGSSPELLPRSSADDDDDEVTPPPELVPPLPSRSASVATERTSMTVEPGSGAVALQAAHAAGVDGEASSQEGSRPRRLTPGIDVPLVRFHVNAEARDPSPDALMGRAPTEHVTPVPPPRGAVALGAPLRGSGGFPAIPGGAEGTGGGIAQTGGTAERTISAAFDAIMDALPTGDAPDRTPSRPAAELDDVAHVHSPALPSAPAPPGAAPERAGTYAQYKPTTSSSMAIPRSAVQTTAPPTSTVRPATSGSRATTRPAVAAANRAAPPPIPSRPTAPTTPPSPAGRPAQRTSPSGSMAVPGVGRPPSPSTSARRPASGVVVSRPAVIVGAPPKIVGGATAPAAPSRTTPRQRKAREDADGGLFGQDLISEKSLDEVILAYLSEDSKDED